VGETKPRISKTKEINKKSFVNETSKAQRIRLQESSPFGALKSWNLIRVIVKSIDDVRQEQFAMQLISQIYQIFKIKKLPLYLKTYEILATGPNCGLIEVINDAMSIDEIHKRADNASLLDYFVVKHGRGKIKS
jgi:phosphatidylinositol kinase/protein kinase (PI-3  family)